MRVTILKFVTVRSATVNKKQKHDATTNISGSRSPESTVKMTACVNNDRSSTFLPRFVNNNLNIHTVQSEPSIQKKLLELHIYRHIGLKFNTVYKSQPHSSAGANKVCFGGLAIQLYIIIIVEIKNAFKWQTGNKMKVNLLFYIYWMHCTELGNIHFQNILNLSDANIEAKKNGTSNKDTHKTAFSIML